MISPEMTVTPRLTGSIKASGLLDSTAHDLWIGDARDLSFIPDASIGAVITSPPYGSLKEYPEQAGQMGNFPSYDEFLVELDKVWRECMRVLIPGGRICAVVGDICLSRRKAGRHQVLPLSSDIQVRGRGIGFEVLTPIIWSKVANISLEASRSSRFLGKPYLPGGVIKNDRETIILMRKPGYRSPTPEMERASKIEKQDYFDWFLPIWAGVTGASTRHHPAPYPLEIPRRLVSMFSFAGDVVLDPFGGTGTTAEAAIRLGRSSISVDVEPTYVTMARTRLAAYQLGPSNMDGPSDAPTITLKPRLLDGTAPYIS